MGPNVLKEGNEYEAGANKGLEKILLDWFQQIYSENMLIKRPILCQKATDIAFRLKIVNFKASDWWLQRHLK
jgi:arsenate reductase-like glutaredoxin family protein